MLCWIQSVVAVQSLSCVQHFPTPWTTAHQASLSFTISRACSGSCPPSQWCHPIISSSVVPFSSSQPSFPASGSFPVNQLYASGGQRIAVSASASTFAVNIQDWFPLGLTGLISLLSKGLKSLLQHHSSKASVLWRSAFFIVQLSHPYMTTGKTIAAINFYFWYINWRMCCKGLCLHIIFPMRPFCLHSL